MKIQNNEELSVEAKKAIQHCIDKGIAFICFRLPQQESQLWLVDSGQESQQGFVFKPFNDHEVPALCFQPLKAYSLKHLGTEEIAEIESFQGEFPVFPDKPYIASKEEYLYQADECLEWLNWQNNGKVILSRIKSFDTYNYHQGAAIFTALERGFPLSLCYLLYSPLTGFWCGAFQERLLQNTKQGFFSEALAGTQTIQGEEPTRWNKKEKHEQQLVANYLQENLLKIGATNIKKGVCSTVRSGQIVHLQTPYTFQLTPTQINEFIKQIHPSPAICGLPKQEAYQLIQAIEPHQRSYYCGLVGLLDYQDQTQLFINLRCMQLFKDEICIYAGGGITNDSIPEDEWEETSWKINNIINTIATLS